jgi:uncharacterized protein (DUF697 family)
MKKAVAQTGSLGTVRSFVSVLREISFDDVRDQAETIPRLLVLAPTVARARDLGVRLTGNSGELAITARELGSPPPDLDRFDAIIVDDPAGTGVARSLHDRQIAAGGTSVVHSYDAHATAGDGALEILRQRVVRGVPERAPAFGRAFPVFRPAASRAVISETATANAQFALVSNIPALLPVIGGLASASADFIVLTKNQVMMMYKLGAMHDRDLNNQVAIIQELVPIVGAGFLWRSLARGAVSFLPFAAGTVPKVAIAYAGTMVIGLAAEYYYRTNRRPSRAQLRAFQAQALELMRRLPLRALQQRGSAADVPTEITAASAATPPPITLLPSAGQLGDGETDQPDPIESATQGR